MWTAGRGRKNKPEQNLVWACWPESDHCSGLLVTVFLRPGRSVSETKCSVLDDHVVYAFHALGWPCRHSVVVHDKEPAALGAALGGPPGRILRNDYFPFAAVRAKGLSGGAGFRPIARTAAGSWGNQVNSRERRGAALLSGLSA